MEQMGPDPFYFFFSRVALRQEKKKAVRYLVPPRGVLKGGGGEWEEKSGLAGVGAEGVQGRNR